MTKKWLVWYLSFMMLVVAMTRPAEAAFAPSDALAVSGGEKAEDLARIQAVLETKIVRAHLSSLGFTPSEVGERLSSLTAERLHSLAVSLDEAKTGGVGGTGVLIGVAIIALVILVILPLVGIKVWR